MCKTGFDSQVMILNVFLKITLTAHVPPPFIANAIKVFHIFLEYFPNMFSILISALMWGNSRFVFFLVGKHLQKHPNSLPRQRSHLSSCISERWWRKSSPRESLGRTRTGRTTKRSPPSPTTA